MTLSIRIKRRYAECHMLSVAFSYCNADCLYAVFLYAACPYAECHSQEEACPMPEWSILWCPTLILISQPNMIQARKRCSGQTL
jgi:hypothetical protein